MLKIKDGENVKVKL